MKLVLQKCKNVFCLGHALQSKLPFELNLILRIVEIFNPSFKDSFVELKHAAHLLTATHKKKYLDTYDPHGTKMIKVRKPVSVS